MQVNGSSHDCHSGFLPKVGELNGMVSITASGHTELPMRPNAYKRTNGWWTHELTELKHAARAAFDVSTANPLDVDATERVLAAKKAYKAGIRRAKSVFADRKRASLVMKWTNADKDSFWKEWKQHAGTNKRAVVPEYVLPKFEKMCA